MGYRSTIAVAIYGDDRDADKYGLLKTLMNTTFKEVYAENDDCAEWLDHTHVLMFRFEDVKWYETYPDVIRFTTMLEEIEGLGDYNFEFVRIGEDDDDIERRNGGDNCLYLLSVARAIQVDL